MDTDLVILIAVGKRIKELGISPDSPVPNTLPPQQVIERMKSKNSHLQSMINKYDLSLEP